MVEDDAFILAVKNIDPSRVLCHYEDGLKTLEVALAANQSMKTGKSIRLPLRTI